MLGVLGGLVLRYPPIIDDSSPPLSPTLPLVPPFKADQLPEVRPPTFHPLTLLSSGSVLSLPANHTSITGRWGLPEGASICRLLFAVFRPCPQWRPTLTSRLEHRGGVGSGWLLGPRVLFPRLLQPLTLHVSFWVSSWLPCSQLVAWSGPSPNSGTSHPR